jgi:hypothetical protein
MAPKLMLNAKKGKQPPIFLFFIVPGVTFDYAMVKGVHFRNHLQPEPMGRCFPF